LPECLEWLNRAALSAPVNFAPLHLLRASALLAMGDNARAADELDMYLQFPSVNASQRELLTQECIGCANCHRRTLPHPPPPATSSARSTRRDVFARHICIRPPDPFELCV